MDFDWDGHWTGIGAGADEQFERFERFKAG